MFHKIWVDSREFVNKRRFCTPQPMIFMQHVFERRLRFWRIDSELSVCPRLNAVVVRLGDRSPAFVPSLAVSYSLAFQFLKDCVRELDSPAPKVHKPAVNQLASGIT
jgi:hypothetical protein